jgi:hypothetical protein
LFFFILTNSLFYTVTFLLFEEAERTKMDFSKINLSSYMPAMPYKVRELFDKATNIVMNYTETEAKVVEATNDESWGPPGKLLQELAQLSHSYEHYNEVKSYIRNIRFSFFL